MDTNKQLNCRRLNAIANGIVSATDIFIEKARNAEVWDVEGKRYIDFAGGIGVLNTGHCLPKIMAAVEAQIKKFTHSAFQACAYECYIELAETLNKIAPGASEKKSLFVTTGAEAVENAVKCARSFTKRTGLIAFDGAFHGRTFTALSLTGKVNPYRNHLGVMPDAVFHSAFPYPYRGISTEDALNSLEDIFRYEIDPAAVAAIVIEPVQGEGGFRVAPPEFMQALRQICDQHGIVFIVDEIQTGFGRTGKLFALEYSGVEADIMTVAKSLAGGFPIAGMVGKKEIMDAALPGTLGGTYAGNPLACVAALEVLKIIKKENLLARSEFIGNLFKTKLQAVMGTNIGNTIGEIRGLGAMVAVEFVTSQQSTKPNPELLTMFRNQALKNGLITLASGVYANTSRILCPLTITDDHLNEGIEIYIQSLAEIS